MGRRGPVPKPGSFDTIQGRNTYHRSAPSPSPVPVDPPAIVQADEVALGFWNEHAPLLIESRRLRPEQAHALGVLCCLHSEILVLSAGVASAGHVIETPRGPVTNPAAKMLRDARRDFVSLAKEFGMTAASEARIPQEPPSNVDDDEAELRAFTG
jgi:phage terminase small subunit